MRDGRIVIDLRPRRRRAGGEGPHRRPLAEFAIAGADRRFVRAEAAIEGDRVVVWSEHVPEPVAVRYAWADNPEGANLFNAEGLPASPFRSTPGGRGP